MFIGDNFLCSEPIPNWIEFGSFSFSFFPLCGRGTCRYEIEYDENRLVIGREIGRRFLGIECDERHVNANVADSGIVVVNLSNNIVKSGNENGSGEGTNNENSIGNNTTTVAKVTSGSGGGGGGFGTGDTDNKPNNQIKDSNITSDEINLNCEKDELVLDVLNDDLIAKVRGKITSTCGWYVDIAFFHSHLHINPNEQLIS